jgi:hypothetical protein
LYNAAGPAGTSNNVEARIQMTAPRFSTSVRRSLPAHLGLASWRGRGAWLAGLVVLALLICWLLARMTPAWYVALDPADDGVQRTAGEAQNRLIVDLHNATERLPLGEQRWSITQDEVNALLAVKADLQRSPISDPYVVFSRGQVTLCARLRQLPGDDPAGGVGSLTFAVGTVNDANRGEAMGLVKLTQVWAGKLPLPRSLIEGRLRAQVPEIMEAARQAVEMQFGARAAEKARPIIEQIVRSAGTGQHFPLRYPWDTREFVIRELRVDDGAFTIVLAPVKPAATDPRAAPAP